MKLNKILIAGLIFFAFLSCENSKLITYEGDDYINFGPSLDFIYTTPTNENDPYLWDTTSVYSFFFDPDSTSKTLYYDLHVSGGPKNFDRQFQLKQVTVSPRVVINETTGKDSIIEVNNAVPGVNYIAFDSNEMQSVYVMKAGEVHMKVPIVLLRDNTLKDYVLQFELVENNHFKLGNNLYTWRRAEFTNNIDKPIEWDSNVDLYIGDYSRVLHAFLIETTGKKWDDEFLISINRSFDFLLYYDYVLTLALREYERDNGDLIDENGKKVESQNLQGD